MSFKTTRKNRQIAIRKQRTFKYTDEYDYYELPQEEEQPDFSDQINQCKIRDNAAFLQACDYGNIERVSILYMSPFLDDETVQEGHRLLEERRPRDKRHSLLLQFFKVYPHKPSTILTF